MVNLWFMVRSGAALKQKSFGVGVLLEFNGRYLVFRFHGFDAAKKFELTSAPGNGFIAVDTPKFSAFIDKYGAVLDS